MMFASHLDAARSHVIGNALREPLLQLRTALQADVAYLIFQAGPRAYSDIVSGNCDDERLAFLPGETVTVKHRLNIHLPQLVNDLRLDSRLRSFSNRLGSALCVPWRHSEGQAWLIIGNFLKSSRLSNVSANEQTLDLLEGFRCKVS